MKAREDRSLFKERNLHVTCSVVGRAINNGKDGTGKERGPERVV